MGNNAVQNFFPPFRATFIKNCLFFFPLGSFQFLVVYFFNAFLLYVYILSKIARCIAVQFDPNSPVIITLCAAFTEIDKTAQTPLMYSQILNYLPLQGFKSLQVHK